LAKSEVKLTKLIEGYRTSLVAKGKLEDKKYSLEDLTKLKPSAPLTKYMAAIRNA
jgi:hypothetical protein